MNLSEKITLAHQSFLDWRKVSYENRQKLLFSLADVLEKNKEDYAKIITTEMHKPISQSLAEITKSTGMIRFYANSKNVLLPETIESEFEICDVCREPMGVILGVMPWNFPFWQVLRFAVPAILAGNTILLKHASICFGSGEAIEKLFLEAGFSNGIFQNLKVGHQEVETILENDFVKGVSLTGSGPAGGTVASIAGKHIKKSVLELGGSDAFIVLEDGDYEKAAKDGLKAKLQNSGQVCNAAKRFIIHQDIMDRFLSVFKECFKNYVPADPFLLETNMSKMARPDLADELESQYKKALDNGAEIIIPLQRLSESAFLPGLILVKEGNPILQEELFGPLAMLMVGTSDDDILALANDIPFGLGNSVWTRNRERAEFFIRNLESGTVSVNKTTSSDTRFPFGGAKASGYGVELSLLAVREFTQIKMVVGNW